MGFALLSPAVALTQFDCGVQIGLSTSAAKGKIAPLSGGIRLMQCRFDGCPQNRAARVVEGFDITFDN
jgi:hypothetical protein